MSAPPLGGGTYFNQGDIIRESKMDDTREFAGQRGESNSGTSSARLLYVARMKRIKGVQRAVGYSSNCSLHDFTLQMVVMTKRSGGNFWPTCVPGKRPYSLSGRLRNRMAESTTMKTMNLIILVCRYAAGRPSARIIYVRSPKVMRPVRDMRLLFSADGETPMQRVSRFLGRIARKLQRNGEH